MVEVVAPREASISNEKSDRADYKVFTDGLDHNGGVGVVAVLFAKDWPCPLSHLKAYLGTSKKVSNSEAEITGGILALKLIEELLGVGNLTISIFTDNQAFVQATVRPKAAPGQYLLQMQGWLRRLSHGAKGPKSVVAYSSVKNRA